MLNRVILIGRMTADAELKMTGSGIPVATLRIAVDRPFKNASGEKETDFVTLVAWRQSAEFAANYLGKGRLIAAEGRLQVRSYDAQDGGRRTVYEVVCDNLRGLDKPSGDRGAPVAAAAAEPDSYEDPFAGE